MSKKLILKGQRFGRLIAIKDTGERKRNNVIWLCKCDCGNTVKVEAVSLKRGNTNSCGCLQKETAKIMMFKHGDCKERLYKIYNSMKGRCYNYKNDNYRLYGYRGIKVCDLWVNNYLSFKKWALLNGYNDSLTIDRINTNGDYCPENCRWVNMEVQANNRRGNHFITFQNKTKTVAEWAKELGIKYNCLSTRLSRGWSIKDALYTPVLKK